VSDPAILWQLAKSFASISLVAIGGANAVVPAIRHESVDVLHWMDEATFGHLFAIAQAAPGPNVLLVSIVGWHVAGLAGLLVATLAMLLPACLLAFAIGRLARRISGSRGFRIAQDALVPLAVGLIVASGIDMTRAVGDRPINLALAGATALYIFCTRGNPIWALLASAGIALAGHALGAAA